MSATLQRTMTPQEYLEMDRVSEGKHEYAYGKVIPMPGGSDEHSTITANIIGVLFSVLKNTGCKAKDGAMRVRITGTSNYRYPDASIVCGAPILEGSVRDVLTNPCAVVEVLSPSTMNKDRTIKLREYQTIPSLREIILVEQDQPLVHQIHRRDDGGWGLRMLAGLDEKLELVSVPVQLPFRDIYDAIDFPPLDDPQ